MNKNTKIRWGIYAGNIVPSLISRKLNLGNPLGVLVFGALDLVSYYSEGVRTSKYTRLVKFAGGVYYSVSSISDALGVLKGSANDLVQLPFDASMAYLLLGDAIRSYKGKGRLSRDVRSSSYDARGLVRKLKH